jgi:hypothetical protein
MDGVPIGILQLWLPIVVASLVCFFAGAILYMATPLHKNDWTGVADEDGVLAALRKAGVGAGQYMFPWCADAKARSSPEHQKKWAEGPSGFMVLKQPGPVTMGPMMMQMVAYHLVVSVFVAYLAGRMLAPGQDYLAVFRLVGTAATMAYGFGAVPMKIWYGFKWGFIFRIFIDGLINGLLTAGVFGWLWPR